MHVHTCSPRWSHTRIEPKTHSVRMYRQAILYDLEANGELPILPWPNWPMLASKQSPRKTLASVSSQFEDTQELVAALYQAATLEEQAANEAHLDTEADVHFGLQFDEAWEAGSEYRETQQWPRHEADIEEYVQEYHLRAESRLHLAQTEEEEYRGCHHVLGIICCQREDEATRAMTELRNAEFKYRQAQKKAEAAADKLSACCRRLPQARLRTQESEAWVQSFGHEMEHA